MRQAVSLLIESISYIYRIQDTYTGYRIHIQDTGYSVMTLKYTTLKMWLYIKIIEATLFKLKHFSGKEKPNGWL